MSESKIETTKGLCVVAITRFLMNESGWGQEQAYAHLLEMELYKLLMDDETRMFLETNEYLCKCCKIEVEQGVDALYRFINDIEEGE